MIYSRFGKNLNIEYKNIDILILPCKITFEKDMEMAGRIFIKSENNCLISKSVKIRIFFEPEVIL